MKGVTLQELYLRARSGHQDDENRFFQLVGERFQAFTEFKTGDSTAAADIVQTALMTIADKYRRVEIMDDIVPWAHRILLNNIMHYFRAKQIKAKREIQLSEGCVSHRINNPDPLLKMKLRNCLRKLNQANPRHARILNFCYQGYTTTEICEKLGISRNAFYISLSRARSSLRQCLEKGDIAHE
ncbi:RNA polymerase sigma factor [Candidatus Zixiibacteriota bacterium]